MTASNNVMVWTGLLVMNSAILWAAPQRYVKECCKLRAETVVVETVQWVQWVSDWEFRLDVVTQVYS